LILLSNFDVNLLFQKIHLAEINGLKKHSRPEVWGFPRMTTEFLQPESPRARVRALRASWMDTMKGAVTLQKTGEAGNQSGPQQSPWITGTN
jgi:hypothetical protein